MKKTKLTRSLLAACSIVALTAVMYGCVHNGGSDTTTDGTEMEQTPQEQIAALQTQINALRAELGLDPIDIDDLTGSVAQLTQQVATLQKQVDDAAAAEAEEAAKAMMAKLNKLATGIGVVDQTSPAVAPRAADARMMGMKDTALDAPHMISGWSGMSWESKAGAGATATTTTAVVYSDKEADTPSAFNKRFTIIATGQTNAGNVALTVAAHAKLIDISGLPTHPSHAGVQVGVTNGVKGTLAGADGTFTGASAAIEVQVDADGVPTWTGDLLFKPDSATATVMMPDTSYSSLGWWLTEAANGDLTPEVAAWASDDYSGTLPTVGTATYAGIAVGKYTHKTINSISGGHFNADAELEAAFDTGGTTITGTIDNFMSDGESIGDGWKVELANTQSDAASFDAAAGATIASGAGLTAAAYSARGTFGTQTTPGTWTAQFVDDSRNDAMPGGVVGTFQIGELAHPINMIGAFAASNQEADMPDN